MATDPLRRCPWVPDDPLYRDYHDNEWGAPLHDDRRLFEMLALEAMQAGLSWNTILRKREAFRAAFDRFEPAIVAAYDDRKVEALLQDAGIVRNRAKIQAVIRNAGAVLEIRREWETFDRYIWQFVGGVPRVNRLETIGDYPARTEQSDAMSRDLKARGMNFVGSTICYAFMQSVGMVNDHTIDCFRYRQLADVAGGRRHS